MTEDLNYELDMALQDAKERKKAGQICPFIVVCGSSGSGKTPIIKEWLKEKKLKSIWFDDTFTVDSFYDNQPIIFKPETIDTINDGESVVVFDNYDWVPLSIRKHFFKLIKDSIVIDLREYDFYKNFKIVNLDGSDCPEIRGERKLDNIFMIIVVTHPYLSAFAEDYTEEEKKIFDEHKVVKKK